MSHAHRKIELPEGATYREAVVDAGLRGIDSRWIRVVAGDRPIPEPHWDQPVAADVPVTIRRIPADPISVTFAVLGAIASAASAAAGAVGLGGVLAGVTAGAVGLGAGLGLTGLGLAALQLTVTAIAGFGLAFGASMLVNLAINALVRPPSTSLGGGSSGPENSPTLTGIRNSALLYKPVWRVYGRHRITPPYASLPFHRIIGGEQFFFGVFCLGYGPLEVELASLKVGDTPLSEFEGVEVQIDYGDGVIRDVDLASLSTSPSGQPFEVFSTDVTELGVGAQFFVPDMGNRGPTGWLEPQDWDEAPIRTSASDTRRLELDFLFPSGIATISRKGTRFKVTLSFDIRIRRAAQPGIDHGNGAGNPGDWGPPEQTYDGGPSFFTTLNADPEDGLRFSWTEVHEGQMHRGFGLFCASTPGMWDVQVRKFGTSRLSKAAGPETIIAQAHWSTLRSIRPEDPITLPGVALLGIQIRATDQVNGTLDSFNCVVQSKLPAWGGTTWSTPTATSNPAWIYADMLRGSATKRKVKDSQIDTSRLSEFAAFCTANGFEFNGVFDYQTTLLDGVNAVLSVGRASYLNRDGAHSLVIDQPRTAPVQLLTPRNSLSSRGAFSYTNRPHGLRARFPNRDKGWEQDERIVYADGFDADNATDFEDLPMFGVTSADHVWKLADYHQRVAALRTGTFMRTVDWEHLVAERGDWVKVSDDVILGDVAWGRVVSVVTDGSGAVTSVTIDAEVSFAAGIDHAFTVRSVDSDGGVSVSTYPCTNPATIDPVLSAELIPSTPIPEIMGNPAVNVGDLVSFGELGFDTFDAIILGIRPRGELEAELTLTEYAPEVFNLGAPLPPFTSSIRGSRFALPPAPVLATPIEVGTGVRISVRVPQPSAAQVTPVVLQVQMQRSGTSGWERLPDLQSNATEIVVSGLDPGVAYLIRARTGSGTGTFSAWVTTGFEFVGTEITIDQYKVVGLQLVNGIDLTRFAGRTAHFSWRLSYRSGIDLTHAQVSEPFQPIPNSNILDFVVRVLDAQTLVVVREETIRGFSWDYTLDKQYEDPGPLRREFTVQVAFKDPAGDSVGEFQTLTVRNEAPPITEGTVQRSLAGAIVTFTPSTDPDWAGIVVYVSETPGFSPGPETEIYRGTVNPAVVTVPGPAFYVRWAHFDQFAVDPATNVIDPTVLSISPEVFLTGTGQIDTDDIVPGAITDLFVVDIDDPLGTGNILPTVPSEILLGTLNVTNADDAAKTKITFYFETSSTSNDAYHGQIRFSRNGDFFRAVNFSGFSIVGGLPSSVTVVAIDQNPIVGVNSYAVFGSRVDGVGQIERGACTIIAELFKR